MASMGWSYGYMGMKDTAVETLFVDQYGERNSALFIKSSIKAKQCSGIHMNVNKVTSDRLLYWTGVLILYHSYLVGNLTNSKIAETIALEPLKSGQFSIKNFRTF
jgi:hypothetical protein